MKKRSRFITLLKTIFLSVITLGIYPLFGNMLFKRLLSREAADGGYASQPTEDYVSGTPSNPKHKAIFESPLFPIIQTNATWYTQQQLKKVSTVSSRGVNIHADMVINETPSDRWVICLHGYTARPWVLSSVAKLYYQWGFNILFHYLSGHGDNEDKFISMGWLDRLDVVSWIEYLNEKHHNPKITLHGVSMGGATVMMTTGEELPSNVKCAVEDCGYSSVFEQFSVSLGGRFKNKFIARFAVHALDSITHLRLGFSIRDASCVEQVKKSKTPTLFMHGENDKAVLLWMHGKVYDACPCEKEMLIGPDAGHGDTIYLHPELYNKTLRGFLEKHVGQLP